MGANLTRFVGDVYAISPHAHPILITALSRRGFVNGTEKINNALADWAAGGFDCTSVDSRSLMSPIASAETERVASATNTTLLPLNAASINYLQAIGPNASAILNRLPADFTHLNLGGQALFGRMVADLMNVIVGFGTALPGVYPPFVPNPPLSSAIWGGQQYVFEVRWLCAGRYTFGLRATSRRDLRQSVRLTMRPSAWAMSRGRSKGDPQDAEEEKAKAKGSATTL